MREEVDGIPIIRFIDPSVIIGAGTEVWHFARVLSGVTLGENVSIGAGAEIGRGSAIGNGSRIGAGTFLPPNSVVGQNVFIGPNVTCTDDRHPKVPGPFDAPYNAEPPVVEDGAAIGAACTLLPGVKIGMGARIGAGSLVTKDVVRYDSVRGRPARHFTVPPGWDPLGPLTGPGKLQT